MMSAATSVLSPPPAKADASLGRCEIFSRKILEARFCQALSGHVARLTDSRVRELFAEASGESLHVVVKNGIVKYIV